MSAVIAGSRWRRDLLHALGFAEAKSVLQSGNLVFRSSRHTPTALERLLEMESTNRLGMRVSKLIVQDLSATRSPALSHATGLIPGAASLPGDPGTSGTRPSR